MSVNAACSCGQLLPDATLGFGGKREDLSVSAERTSFGVWVSRPDGKKGALQSPESM